MSNPATSCPVIRQRFMDANDEPLSGALLYSYEAGTSTPAVTYKDATGGTPNTNPIVLDSQGYCDVWLETGSYKFVLQDSDNNLLWTQDNVESLQQAIADQISVAGALAAANNLSDLTNVSAALENLGVSPYTYPTKFSVTSGQSAANLSGETVDGTVYTSAVYQFEIQQGTTIFASGHFYLQYLNGSWQLFMGDTVDNGTVNGVTFSVTQSTTIAQLRAAESGLGNGTIKLKKSYFLATS